MKRGITAGLLASVLVAAPAPAQSPTTRGYDESGVLGSTTGQQGTLSGNSGGQSGKLDGAPGTGGVLGRGYDESGVLGTVSDTSRTNGADKASELPFTGFEAGLVGLMGAALLGTGLVLRRTQRRPAA